MAAWNILIYKSSSGQYEVRVRSPGSSGGGHKFKRRLPPDFSDFISAQPDAKPTRRWRRPPTSVPHEDLLFCAGNLDTLKEIGDRLYNSIFRVGPASRPKDLTEEFLTARSVAATYGTSLDLEIDLSETPELSRVPWESLYIAGKDLLLGIDGQTNIVRRLESDQGAGLPPSIEPPVRMLVVVANPSGELEAGTEVGNIERRLGSLLRKNDESYEIATLEQATRVELHDRIEDWKPHIIHFIGHGGFHDQKGLVYLHSGKDPAARDAIDGDTLRDLVRNDRPWLVVLNNCLSGAAAKADPFGGAAQSLIRANVPFVVAMQAPISDDAAIRFSQSFYAALARGESVATAVTRGRTGIRALEDEDLRPELITPVLYSTGKAERLAVLERPPQAARLPIWKAIWADIRQSGITQITLGLIGLAVAILAFAYSASNNPQLAAPRSQTADVTAQGQANFAFDDQAPAEAGNSASSIEEGRFEQYSYSDGALEDRRPLPVTEGSPPPAPAPAPVTGPARSHARADAPGPRALRRRLAAIERMQSALRERAAAVVRGLVIGLRSGQDHYAYDIPIRSQEIMPLRFGSPEVVVRSSGGEYVAFELGDVPDESPMERGSLAATFGWQSASPARIDIEAYSHILLAPAGAPMAVELVGRSGADEAPAGDDRLGLARAQAVADRFRAAGIPAERIALASAAGRWAQPGVPGYAPAWERRTDARLGLRDANRIGFPAGSAELPGEAGPMLDRLAAFARDNRGFLLQLEAHSERSETPLGIDRARAEAVRTGLRSRGVDDARITMLAYSDTHPEVIGARLAGAERRVQIVLIPIADPDPRAGDEEPAEEP